MNAVEYLLEAPEPGVAVRVTEDVEWIRLPLPFRPSHVNVYRLLDDAGRPFVVDAGLADHETTRAWDAVGRIPERLVVTHFHPDHIGQAARLETMGVGIHAPAPELAHARVLHAMSPERVQATLAAFFQANGLRFPEGANRIGNGYRRAVPTLPATAEPLALGPLSYARRWSVRFASGHSPAHALLYRAEDPVLAAGDILLPEISPNISVWPDSPDADPLGEYLSALDRLRELPEATVVLPAHGVPYRGVHQRIEALVTHHERRLNVLRAAAGGGLICAADVIPRLFSPDLKPASLPFALGEALAHLNRLWHAGEFGRMRDDAGVWRYHARG